jgi:hypothetical protein
MGAMRLMEPLVGQQRAEELVVPVRKGSSSLAASGSQQNRASVVSRAIHGKKEWR